MKKKKECELSENEWAKRGEEEEKKKKKIGGGRQGGLSFGFALMCV